jgi:signal transduction histidine kinase
MTTWEEVKKKIQSLESSPIMDPESLRAVDVVYVADYWRRRFEEERSLWEKRVESKDFEIGQLKERTERALAEVQVMRQQVDGVRAQLADRQQYWEERHERLSVENRSLQEKIDRLAWEMRTRALEEQNRRLAEKLREQAGPAGPEPGSRGTESLQAPVLRNPRDLREKLVSLRGESAGPEEGGVRPPGQPPDSEWLLKAKEELERKLQDAEAELDPLKKELHGVQQKTWMLGESLGRLKKYVQERERQHLSFQEDLGLGFAQRIRQDIEALKIALQNVLPEGGGAAAQKKIAMVEQRLQEIVKRLEELSFFVGIPEMSLEALDVNDFIARTLAASVEKAEGKNVHVQWKLGSGIPPFKTDSLLLGEALLAVTGNAVEALAEGGRIDVETAYDPSDQTLMLRVRDSGPGISPEHMAKVFQPYFTTRKDHKGLGLCLCKRVVELLGGTLRLESVRGEGTTVTFAFPLGLLSVSEGQKADL